MTTLYVRDVPEEVVQTLKGRAADEGKSLSAYVVSELSKIASRPTTAQLVERLRQQDRAAGPTTEEILEAVTRSRR